MNEFTQHLQTTLRGIWRHRWLGVAVAWALALGGATVVQTVPERHEARARIYVDTQTVLKPLMAGLAFQPDIDQQVRMLGRTLVSRPNVERLVNDAEIGLLKGRPQNADELIDDLTKSIKVEQTGGNNLYAISYRDTDPQRAERVVKGLVTLFIGAGADTKRRDSEDASRFIDEQIKTYESKLSAAEAKLKDFKLRNMDVATGNNDSFARMTALSEDIDKLRVQAAAAQRSRDALRTELAHEPAQLPVEAPPPVPVQPQGSVTPELDARIDGQRRQLDDLLRRYTDQHPDVLNVRRTIGQLEAQRRQEQEQRQREAQQARQAALAAAPKAPQGGAAATSPIYQRLRVALAESEANYSALQGQIEAQQRRIDVIRSQATKAPQAEAELAQLNRDYDIIRKNYEQLVSRREAASLGVKIDQNGSLADFRLIEPPRVLPQPVFPGKRALALIVMVLALAGGAAAAYGRSMMLPIIASERELREISRRPVLGSLGLVSDPVLLAAVTQDRRRLLLALGAFLGLHLVWMAWVVSRTAAA
ncbi:MAG: hypothetical protein RL722_453 [Pseudomonadota bacterium]|jgi:polysaccharide chain length determinant protein (PEP-CTERM system associated)